MSESSNKLSQFKLLEERVQKNHVQVDIVMEKLEAEKSKGYQLTKQLQELNSELETERNRPSEYFESQIQHEIEGTLNSAIIDEIQAQKKLQDTNKLIKEREGMSVELEYNATQNKIVPKELKQTIAMLDGEEPKLNAQVKTLKEENKLLSEELKLVNSSIATAKQEAIEWERKAMNVKDLLPYINQYVDTDGNVRHSKDTSPSKKPIEVVKASPSKAKITSNYLKDDEDFWMNKDSESKAKIAAQKINQIL